MLNDDQKDLLMRLFAAGSELPAPARAAFVQRECGQDIDVQRELAELLQVEQSSLDDFLASPAVALPEDEPETWMATPAEAPKVQPVPEIDGYTDFVRIAEGGMGTVFRAEQLRPVRRTVAVKVIRPGMDSEDVLGRFEAERQALAMMSHPYIAAVHDAGTDATGRPFIAMEFVPGLPLDDFCETEKLSLDERLELFLKVCKAVDHAHRRGVLHRDLKPSNVIVSRGTDEVMPKVIDFGIAKAMQGSLGEHSIHTREGSFLGTPEYMSPEQIDGSLQNVDTRSDVYSLGVMLYELLAHARPIDSERLRDAGFARMTKIMREEVPPKPSTRLRNLQTTAVRHAPPPVDDSTWLRRLQGDLDWIVMKAIEKEPDQRYASPRDLAADLENYLTHRPVTAGPPSGLYRLRKFTRRYRVQVTAAALVLLSLVLGLFGTMWFLVEANQQASDNLKLAQAESKARQQFATKVNEFDQLAGLVRYERTTAGEADLFPAWPSEIDAMRQWLDTDCRPLLAMRPKIENTIESLRQAALPQSPEEQQRDFETHPRHEEWLTSKRQLRSLRYAQAIRTGQASRTPVELTTEQQEFDPVKLDKFAWTRIAPTAEDRTVWGEEALGLRAAQLATAKSPDGAVPLGILKTLAWALLANGQDAEARQRAEELVASANDVQRPVAATNLREITDAADRSVEILQQATAAHATLDEAVHRRHTWTFASDREADGFLHDTLEQLLTKLESLQQHELVAVERRLRWAQSIESLSLHHPRAKLSWSEVRAQIAANANYAGQTIELRDQDVLGLVPMGRNPVTDYFEFYHLRSAWDGEVDPATIPIPEHAADGSIAVTGDTGIVFVLLPGGTMQLGSQGDDENAPFYAAQRQQSELLHEVELSPFFLARHEVTRGQWQRLWHGADDQRRPSQVNGTRITDAHPVEQVDWHMCDAMLTRHRLMLPTEAQWEYSCRGLTTTPWCVDLSELKAYANLADATAKQNVPSWNCETWNDGHFVHAPVGTFGANAFGLYDVHGNVWEWCRDYWGAYVGELRRGDGLPLGYSSGGARVLRGGGFNDSAANSRSATRERATPSVRYNINGVRAARSITP